MRAFKVAYKRSGKVAQLGQLGALLNRIPASVVLPTLATDSQVLDYSGLGLNATQVDAVINKLYSDGYCTNCIIDLSNNSVPTAASSTALAGLRNTAGMNNTVIVDSDPRYWTESDSDYYVTEDGLDYYVVEAL